MRSRGWTLTLLVALLLPATAHAGWRWGLGAGAGAPGDGEAGPALRGELLLRAGRGSLRLEASAAYFTLSAPDGIDTSGYAAALAAGTALHALPPGAFVDAWIGPLLGFGGEHRSAEPVTATAQWLGVGGGAGAAWKLFDGWELGPQATALWTGIRRQCVDVTVARCDTRSPPRAFIAVAGVTLRRR